MALIVCISIYIQDVHYLQFIRWFRQQQFKKFERRRGVLNETVDPKVKKKQPLFVLTSLYYILYRKRPSVIL